MKRINKKLKEIVCPVFALFMGAGILYGMPVTARAADYEARIGDTRYEELEEAFANAQAGDTITVLKDCSVSGTLEVLADQIRLTSEDPENPATISREEGFSGKPYAAGADEVLLCVADGSLSTQDIILDGGAVSEGDFTNSGSAWNSPLVYVKGTYTMEEGTVLQNNYNTKGSEDSAHTAGGLQLVQGGTFAMNGGVIQNCYTAGDGGGIQTETDSRFTVASGIVRKCYGTLGGGMNLHGEAELSGMTLTGNAAGTSGGAICSTAPLTVTDSLIEGNCSAYDGGGICTATGHRPKLIGCTFNGNTALRGSAVQTTKGEGTEPLEIRDCTFRGNLSGEEILAGGTICYMNETGIILSGKIVMEDNLTAGVSPCDILFVYNTGASILLDKDFESDSTFVIGGYDGVKPGRVLIDGKLYHKEPSAEQFVWHTKEYCTERRGENLYLAEVPAVKTVTITYVYNNGAEDWTDTAHVIPGEDFAFPDASRKGYCFKGWYEDEALTVFAGEGGEIRPAPQEDTAYYAAWEKEETTYLITFDPNGGSKAEPIRAAKGKNIILPGTEKKDHIFLGWYTEKTGGSFLGIAGDKLEVTKDMTVYALWEKAKKGNANDDDADQGSHAETKDTCTVKYDANGGTVKESSVKVEKGAGVKLPTAEREGFSFTGWYTDNQVFVGKAGDTYQPDQDITLYAKWEKAAVGDGGGYIADGIDSAAKTGTSAAGTRTGTAGADIQKEPVIQTGRTSPICFLAAIGISGVLLAALSIRAGKRRSDK